VKVIDDVLVWDFTYEEHLLRVRTTILKRCRDYKITMNRDEFVFANPSVQFCCHNFSEDVIADMNKVKGIAEFPPLD